jgi:hypothetical protein
MLLVMAWAVPVFAEQGAENSSATDATTTTTSQATVAVTSTLAATPAILPSATLVMTPTLAAIPVILLSATPVVTPTLAATPVILPSATPVMTPTLVATPLVTPTLALDPTAPPSVESSSKQGIISADPDPGGLTITPQTIAFPTISLNGRTQQSCGTTAPWTVQDATGAGGGWHATAVATDFSDGAAHTIAKTGFAMRLLAEGITTVVGNAAPTSPLMSYTSIGGDTAITFVSAPAGMGMGTYNLTPTFQLLVPADAHTGTYVSTVTVSIIAGPG